jgi:uncharacterized protein
MFTFHNVFYRDDLDRLSLSRVIATPLVPAARGIYADGDMVIIFFDATATTDDGQSDHSTYTWYSRMKDKKMVSATAFFDTRAFDDFWNRVSSAK